MRKSPKCAAAPCPPWCANGVSRAPGSADAWAPTRRRPDRAGAGMIRNEPRLQALFAAASELAPAQRDELLTRECADDPGLRAEIEALLAADARLQGTTARPFISPFALQLPASLVGRRVGAWELREEIGHGGMGTVYRAERVDGSVQQSVAIKFVRRELLDAVTRRRFEL